MNFRHAPKSPITGVPGWITDTEERKLIELAKSVKGNVVQSGSEWGRITAALLESGNPVYVRAFGFPDIHSANLEMVGYSCEYLANNQIVPEIALLVLSFTDKHQLESEFQKYRANMLSQGIIVIRNYATHPGSHPLHYEIKDAVDSWPIADYGDVEIVAGDDLLILRLPFTLKERQTEDDELILTPYDNDEPIPLDDLPLDYDGLDALTVDDLKQIGEANGISMGRYSKRSSIIKRLRKEGLVE